MSLAGTLEAIRAAAASSGPTDSGDGILPDTPAPAPVPAPEPAPEAAEDKDPHPPPRTSPPPTAEEAAHTDTADLITV
jgi:hypothetical protein